ncbi:MAG: ABC transporter permease, partial [Rhodospirillales bacterium]|nr:ABC transporter permease [Rhodospirillales bacterium]
MTLSAQLPVKAALEARSLADGALELRLAGPWTLHSDRPSPEEVVRRLDASPKPKRLVIAAAEVSEWDSGLLTFLTSVKAQATARHIDIDATAIPEGARKLLALAGAVPEKKGARREGKSDPFLARVGKRAQGWLAGFADATSFVGEVAMAVGRLVTGKARFRRSDLVLVIQEVGAQALPIVSLISFLVGVILAFVGALQLSMFGAQIFVSNLVAIGMSREMGAMMAAIIMAGRTGAAFAAQIGTMQVNEEVDALQTFGIP